MCMLRSLNNSLAYAQNKITNNNLHNIHFPFIQALFYSILTYIENTISLQPPNPNTAYRQPSQPQPTNQPKGLTCINMQLNTFSHSFTLN